MPPTTSHIHVLSPLRHQCTACGGCCQTTKISLAEGEPEQVTHIGSTLGVTDPVADRHLRMDAGRCVFLDPQELCRIHAQMGAESKPFVCRQYPLILLRTAQGELRAGIDPGCYHYFRSWRSGPLLAPRSGGVEHRPFSSLLHQQEAHLLDLLDMEGITLAGVIRQLAGLPGEGLPPLLAGRLMELLRNSGLHDILTRAEVGPVMRRYLLPLVGAIQTWDPARPPRLQMAPEAEAFVLESIKLMLWLRLGPSGTNPTAITWLMVVGAVGLAWADPSIANLAPGLAAWSRAIRSPLLWRAVFPNPDTILWLIQGGDTPFRQA